MITIHKFKLKPGNVTAKECDEILEIEGLLHILHAGLDGEGRLCVWALRHTESGHKKRVKILVRGTGHDCSDVLMAGEGGVEFAHLGSVQQGLYMWHVFALTGEAIDQ